MHFAAQLTQNIEIGAVRLTSQDGLEVVTTDGGQEVRNARTELEPRRYEIAGYTCVPENADYISIREMWTDTERGVHTFMFMDFVDDELVKVRFDSPLQITAPAGHLRKIDTFTLKEVLE